MPLETSIVSEAVLVAASDTGCENVLIKMQKSDNLNY